MKQAVALTGVVTPDDTEVHLCDNYAHLLLAAADLAARRDSVRQQRPLLLFIDDQLELDDRLLHALAEETGAEIVRLSDRGAIESFARLPGCLPPMLRRNVSWASGARPITPSMWSPTALAGRRFGTGYVYHPGFFLSKVLAGHCDTVVMRDSGYANYVRHRVTWGRAVPRLLAGRSPRYQTWGEERWVDRIEVVRPEGLPPRVRHKASRLTLDQLMGSLPRDRARSLAAAFWTGPRPAASRHKPAALLLTQPIDQLGICTTDQKVLLYSEIADRLRSRGFEIVVKTHPRDHTPVLTCEEQIPAAFPIEGWAWLGAPPFELAVSLNSTSLSEPTAPLALQTHQLIPPDRFYRKDWAEWTNIINRSLDDWQANATETSPSTLVEPPVDHGSLRPTSNETTE